MHWKLILLAALGRWHNNARAFIAKGWKCTTWIVGHPLAYTIVIRCLVAAALVTAYVVGHQDGRVQVADLRVSVLILSEDVKEKDLSLIRARAEILALKTAPKEV